jgi:hypothetical protein
MPPPLDLRHANLESLSECVVKCFFKGLEDGNGAKKIEWRIAAIFVILFFFLVATLAASI